MRIECRRRKLATRLLEAAWPPVDRVLVIALVAVQLLIMAWGVAPEVWRELGGRVPPPVAGAAPAAVQVVSGASWVLLLALGACLIVSLWRTWETVEALAALVLGACAAALFAGAFAANVATASALRWTLTGVLLLAGAVCWLRSPIGKRLARLAAGLICRTRATRWRRPSCCC